ncbi:hypothetical protein LDJ79_13795 [Vibrio tritonius]|uniref:Uncharacterized protein n=1 Tax=Vibrio tritonius TaxID=1435069 RepID=A0ABS7YRY4_9VIBR|nr:hypothetical protein [Vibrio tritonius]MCA2017194.1 hypothetical protein [Vibrio tritonius]
MKTATKTLLVIGALVASVGAYAAMGNGMMGSGYNSTTMQQMQNMTPEARQAWMQQQHANHMNGQTTAMNGKGHHGQRGHQGNHGNQGNCPMMGTTTSAQPSSN